MGGTTTNRIEIIRPSDLHVHFREGQMLPLVVPHTADNCAYALPMPNTLEPPLWNGPLAVEYDKKVEDAVPEIRKGLFKRVMCIKMYDDGPFKTTPEIVQEAKALGVRAMKIYPHGVTTNSHDGVADFEKIYPALEMAEEVGMRVCIHGESADPKVDVIDREKVFLSTFRRLVTRFSKLKFVLEHVTTQEAVQCIYDLPDTVAATITAHHLQFSMNDWMGGMLKPNLFCKPIIKRQRDRYALRAAATGGDKKFFFGSDSAPHAEHKKYCESGCAGVYTAPYAIQMVTEIFEEEGKLENLEKFLSINGPEFYKLPRPLGKLIMVKESWEAKEYGYLAGDSTFIPSAVHGRTFKWKIV